MGEKDPLASWKPRRHKGRREVKSRRPTWIVAFRARHSKGSRWEKFVEELEKNGNQLDEYTLMQLMDHGFFGDWKERKFKKIFVKGVFKHPKLEDLDEQNNSNGQRGKPTVQPKQDMDDCPY